MNSSVTGYLVYCWSYLDVSALPGGRRTNNTCPVHHNTYTQTEATQWII